MGHGSCSFANNRHRSTGQPHLEIEPMTRSLHPRLTFDLSHSSSPLPNANNHRPPSARLWTINSPEAEPVYPSSGQNYLTSSHPSLLPGRPYPRHGSLKTAVCACVWPRGRWFLPRRCDAASRRPPSLAVSPNHLTIFPQLSSLPHLPTTHHSPHFHTSNFSP